MWNAIRKEDGRERVYTSAIYGAHSVNTDISDIALSQPMPELTMYLLIDETVYQHTHIHTHTQTHTHKHTHVYLLIDETVLLPLLLFTCCLSNL
jgi:hypothetical protein